MVKLLSKGSFLGNADDYLNVSATEETFTYFGWTDKATDGKNNIFATAEKNLYTIDVQDKATKANRQGSLSTQKAHRRVAVVTTVETRTYKSKQLNRKRSFAFPNGTIVIWITHVFKNQLSSDKIQKINGVDTYKLRGGGRFRIGVIPSAVLDATVAEFKTAKATATAGRLESTTTVTQLDA